jgi:hypothetical protein
MEKEKPNQTLTAGWLLQILLGVAVSAGAYTVKNINADIAELREKQQGYLLQELEIRNQLQNLLEAQRREHKLILLMTHKMGIEVPE